MTVVPFPSQPEIFGRFVLLRRVGRPGGLETFRALDLDREHNPLVSITRLAAMHNYDKKERFAFADAGALHEEITDEAVAAYVDRGDLDGIPWRATEWVTGVAVRDVIDDALAAQATLPPDFTTSVAYIVGSALLDAEGKRSENFLVSLQPRPARVVITPDGRAALLGPAFRLTHPAAEEARYVVDDSDHADCAQLARLTVELSTGRPLPTDGSAVDTGPLGAVPRELWPVIFRAAQGEVPLRDFVMRLQGLMRSTGGGSYAGVRDVVVRIAGARLRQDEQQRERDLGLARRLRQRRRPQPAGGLERVTKNLRIRPASQEGPAEVVVDDAPSGMVLVPGGRFLFAPADEPALYVDVRPFCIDRLPVTCGEYAEFCRQTRHPPPLYWAQPLQLDPNPSLFTPAMRDAPVVEVSRADAEAYAAWAGKRLPTEVEWELAARGFDGRLWPYGNAFDERRTGSDWREPWRERELSPITALPDDASSPFGVTALGCAWEWTSTPQGGVHSMAWVVRGGAWRDRVEPPTLTNRSFETAAAPDVTFRCVKG